MEIEYVTHASLKLRLDGNGTTLLLDPFYFFDDTVASWMCHYPPRRIEPAQLGRIDYVFSSHIHRDHSDPKTLAILKEQIGQVLIPADRPSLKARYESLGFEHIRLLENGRTERLTDDLAVTCIWSNTLDSVLVVEAGATVVLHQNDCELDLPTVQRIGERFRIDYAFMCYTMAQDLYPLLLSRSTGELEYLAREREEERFLHNLACVDAWRPGTVVPYSMTMTYFHPEQLHLNGYGRLVPKEFCDRLRAERPSVKSLVMHPGDVIDAASGQLRCAAGRYRWGDSLADYMVNVAEFARAEAANLPAFDPGESAVAAPTLAALLAARLRDRPIPDLFAGKLVGIHITGSGGDASLYVDLDARLVRAEAPATPHVEITMPASIVDTLVGGEYDPFSILFSYRVKFRLHPSIALPARDECGLLCILFVVLFAPDVLPELLMTEIAPA